MQLTVRAKIVAGLAVILGVGALSLLIIFFGLVRMREGMHEVTNVREPVSAAALEMEINATGIALGALNYLQSAEPWIRRLVEDDESDFERFHAKYLRISEPGEQKALGDSIGSVYRAFRGLANSLMDRKDRQEALFAAFGEGLERIDQLLDDTLQPQVDRDGADGHRKVETLTDLEADIAEMAYWVANFHRAPRPEYEALIFANDREFRRGLSSLNTLALTAAERRGAGTLDEVHGAMMTSVRELLAVEADLREQSRRLMTLRADMDRILDDKIQVLTMRALGEPQRRASADVEVVLGVVRFLIPVFIVSTGVVAVLLIVGITRPIRRLKRGTEAVRSGDLAYRIDAAGQDEFADLSRQFDEMVARLEATTVSKNLLEASEERLREMVVDLRREIHERMEAEREQTRLQASLRRSETMSAMGALVAGVAHEVRNPLFGISSILDAMDVRFAERVELRRYKEMLRGEVERLNELMRELLEYGKPAAQTFSAGSVADVVAEAVVGCSPLAERMRVAIKNEVPVRLAPVLMERLRLLQVFRNLIENAVQHTSSGGSVTLHARNADGDGQRWIDCVVRDSGSGVAPEDLARVFEPFFTRRRGGIGLGLSIVHRIVEQHGGQISAANAPAGGAVFTVRLPATPS